MNKQGVRFVGYEMWKYRYLFLFTASIILSFFILIDSRTISVIYQASNWSYLGAFIAGFFYPYSITAPPVTAIFLVISKTLNPFAMALVGGFGAMLGDVIIFKVIKTELLPEARLLAKDLRIPRIKSNKLLHIVHKIAPFVAGFIIASPLPDELGAGLFGAIEYDLKKFMIISFTCHTIGLLAIALLGQVF
jgi:hypothetical protein